MCQELLGIAESLVSDFCSCVATGTTSTLTKTATVHSVALKTISITSTHSTFTFGIDNFRNGMQFADIDAQRLPSCKSQMSPRLPRPTRYPRRRSSPRPSRLYSQVRCFYQNILHCMRLTSSPGCSAQIIISATETDTTISTAVITAAVGAINLVQKA